MKVQKPVSQLYLEKEITKMDPTFIGSIFFGMDRQHVLKILNSQYIIVSVLFNHFDE